MTRRDCRARNVRERIVQNLADVDFYKLTMLQFIWTHFRGVHDTFRFHNRTNDVNLLDYIDLEEVRRQCERVTKMSFPRWVINKLKKRCGHLFSDAFLEWLAGLRLPMPTVEVCDGKLHIEARGAWEEVMLWETITMCIVNRLYNLGKSKMLGLREQTILSVAHEKLHGKLRRLKRFPGLRFTDFGTRRRWSFAHHQDVLLIVQEVAPSQLTGTSNVLLGLKLGLPLIGTMAHELTMAMQAIEWDMDERNDRLLSQWKLWRMWELHFDGELTIALTDTYGNDFGLLDFQPFAQRWSGVRHDSGDPFTFGEKVIKMYEGIGIDPKNKTIVFSDGLTDERMIDLYRHFRGRIKVAFGWGTHLTNDMGHHAVGIKPLSIVMKLVAVEMNGRTIETVKLSDNPAKATGPREMVQRIMRKTGYKPDEHSRVECEV